MFVADILQITLNFPYKCQKGREKEGKKETVKNLNRNGTERNIFIVVYDFQHLKTVFASDIKKKVNKTACKCQNVIKRKEMVRDTV